MSYKLLLALHSEPGRYAREDPGLVPGDHVKLGFETDPECRDDEGSPSAEWMWFEVTSVTGGWPDLVYRGELCNRPLCISPANLHPGQPVAFRGGHIYSVVRDSPARPEDEREASP
jgi:hypothetical protein